MNKKTSVSNQTFQQFPYSPPHPHERTPKKNMIVFIVFQTIGIMLRFLLSSASVNIWRFLILPILCGYTAAVVKFSNLDVLLCKPCAGANGNERREFKGA